MTKNRKNEFDEIDLLENQLSKKLGAYKEFKNSENNESYFNNIHYKAISKMEKKSSRVNFSFNPAISYAMLFIISFTISFQFIDFSDKVTSNDDSYYFSETSLWLEEGDYLSTIVEGEIELDYATYFDEELNYNNTTSLNDVMNQLSESEFDEIYENLKNKKIL